MVISIELQRQEWIRNTQPRIHRVPARRLSARKRSDQGDRGCQVSKLVQELATLWPLDATPDLAAADVCLHHPDAQNFPCFHWPIVPLPSAGRLASFLDARPWFRM